MVFESLMKFVKEKQLKVIKTTIREDEGEKFGMCIAIQPSGFQKTFHYNKATFSWY